MNEQQFAPIAGHSVLLDIGEDTGALMLFTSPTLTGKRIDLIPDDGVEPQVHGAVRQRNLPQGVSFAAIYPPLRQGIYSAEGSDQKVTITGGRVTTLDYYEDCCRIYYHPSTGFVFAQAS